ncbi:MAG: cytochrome B [Bacteroidota bacterium]|nr:MAG: cytochrome B [Bacteroidota bacterium]
MNTLYTILQAAHSGLRWVVLLLFVLALVNYLLGWQRKRTYQKSDKTLFTLNLSFFHLQVLLGLVLYFVSPRVQFSELTFSIYLIRFFTVEHALIMLFAAILLTVGSVKIKRIAADSKKFRSGFYFLLVSFLLILVAIPWPFYRLGTGWF